MPNVPIPSPGNIIIVNDDGSWTETSAPTSGISPITILERTLKNLAVLTDDDLSQAKTDIEAEAQAAVKETIEEATK